MSDTHLIDVLRGEPIIVPDGDVLVHCGDATMRGSYQEIARFAVRFAGYPHKHKVFVPGNHDWGFQEEHERGNTFGDIDWADVLIDRALTIDGIKFWGSPWQPEFCSWAFNLPRGVELKKHWDLIPADTDVLVTHSPPMGHRDRVWRYEKKWVKQKGHVAPRRVREHVGCADMMLAVKRIKPKVHAFGHVHCDYGQHEHWWGDGTKTHFVNAALADEAYHIVNKPIVVDL